jgi:hypothetical protein
MGVEGGSTIVDISAWTILFVKIAIIEITPMGVILEQLQLSFYLSPIAKYGCQS